MSLVLLGLVDQEVGTDVDVTCSTNKVGGYANWMIPSIVDPTCPDCQHIMHLCVQLYCPLEQCPYRRALHVFTCVQKKCCKQPHRWRAFRSQSPRNEHTTAEASTESVAKQHHIEPDDWGTDADDWGTENVDGTSRHDSPGHLNEVGDITSENNPMTTGHGCFSPHTEYDTSSLLNTHPDPMERVSGQHLSMDTDEASHTFARQHQNNEVSSGNDTAQCGDVSLSVTVLRGGSPCDLDDAIACDTEIDSDPSFELWQLSIEDEGATNEIGMPEESQNMYQLEHSSSGATDENVTNSVATSTFFISYYLNVIEERMQDNVESDHVASLLKDYCHREGPQIRDMLTTAKRHKTESSGGEGYEKSSALHGQKAFYKFHKRVQLCPEQCVRYRWNGQPLLMTDKQTSYVPPCPQCSCERVFEIQLMPALINMLRIPGQTDAVVEFATVLVYTCSGSCWREDKMLMEEIVVIHADPDEHLFK